MKLLHDWASIGTYKSTWDLSNGKIDMIAIVVLGLLAPTLLHAESDSPMHTTSTRVVLKLLGGAVFGVAGSIIGSNVVGFVNENSCDHPDAQGELCIDDEMLLGWLGGHLIGAPIAISVIDKSDRFGYALVGSLVGFGTTGALTYINEDFWPSLTT